MRRILTAFLLLGWAGQAHAQDLKRIDIVEYGTYTSKVDKVVSAPGTPTGTQNLVSDIRHVESTTTVPARLGAEFGFRYRLVGNSGASVKLKKVTHIPAPGIRNPQTGNVNMTSVVFLDRTVGSTSFTSYTFDNSWEIVPGIWTVELWDGDRKMVSQGFLVK